MTNFRLTASSTVVLAALVCTASPALAQNSQPEIVNGDVMYVQDFKEFAPKERGGEEFGGIARLATVINEITAEEGDPTLAIGGDLVGGSLFNSVYEGRPFVEAFNALGADIGNFGSHDFDKGAAHASDLVELADYPWISSNLTTTDGAPFSADGTTAVVNSGELRVGYVAVTTDLDRTPAFRDVIVNDTIEAARAGVAELEGQDVDAIILLSQISRDNTIAVMEAVPELDAALREENGAALPTEIHETNDGRFIVGPDADYGSLVHLDITANRTTGDVEVQPRSIRIDSSIAADPEWQTITDEYLAELDENLGHTIATTEVDLGIPELGVIAADSYREHFGTQLGWQNGGGVRAELPTGPITLADAYSVLPFGNQVTTREVTGEQLLQGLEQGIASNPAGGNGFPRVAGLTFEFTVEPVDGKRITSVTMENGEPLDPNATYSLAISRFPAEGGDGVTAFVDAPEASEEAAIVDIDAFAPYIEAVGTFTEDFDVADDNSGGVGEDDDVVLSSGSSSSTDSGILGVIISVFKSLAAALGVEFSPR